MARRQGRGARKISRAKATIDQLPQITEIFLKIKEGHPPQYGHGQDKPQQNESGGKQTPRVKSFKNARPIYRPAPKLSERVFLFSARDPQGGRRRKDEHQQTNQDGSGKGL